MKQNFFKRHLKHRKNNINAMDAETFLTQRSTLNQLQKEQLENDQRRWQMMVF